MGTAETCANLGFSLTEAVGFRQECCSADWQNGQLCFDQQQISTPILMQAMGQNVQSAARFKPIGSVRNRPQQNKRHFAGILRGIQPRHAGV